MTAMLRTRLVTVAFRSLNIDLIWAFVRGGDLFVRMPKPNRFGAGTASERTHHERTIQHRTVGTILKNR
jgi:hypothetical protein